MPAFFIICCGDALNYSLDAAHSLGKLLSVWARPIYSVNCRVNGIHAHLLDGLLSECDTRPFAYQFIQLNRPGNSILEF